MTDSLSSRRSELEGTHCLLVYESILLDVDHNARIVGFTPVQVAFCSVQKEVSLGFHASQLICTTPQTKMFSCGCGCSPSRRSFASALTTPYS